MHQHPRTPPPTASPASSPWTNPARTNNPRDRARESHSRSGSDTGLYSERGAGQPGGDAGAAGVQSPNQARETKAKLNQIIQNYFTKAAQIIIQSRMAVPPVYARGTDTRKVNKWFNVELDETDAFREELRLWRQCDAEDPRPPPLVLETFLDTAALTNKQTLVIIDEQGKRWDVAEALNASDSSDGRGSSKRRTEVILERWIIELGEPMMELPSDLASILPTVYKKSIVLFRSLYTYSKFLPAWKFEKRLAKLKLNHSALRVNCRIINGDDFAVPPKHDGLNTPLFEGSGNVTEEFSFGMIDSPAGPFAVKVSYRTSCEFRVDDSEALLSSHFINLDEHYFRPSLGARDDQQLGYYTTEKEVGSLPATRRDFEDRPDQGQAYGSLSTFHHVAPPTSSSPLSALRAARDLGSDSPPNSPPRKTLPSMRTTQGVKAPTRPGEGNLPQRRPSVSFQPFKAPSLSASPATPDQTPSSPRNSTGRFPPPSIATQARSRTSIGQPSSSFYRGSPVPPENAIASSASGSPKAAPISRYSSSFTHRRAKLSSGGTSKTDDDNNSSGKGSLASSTAQPGSGMLTEGGQGGSSGSVQTDDDNISDFLKLLDKQKNLKSFEAPSDAASADASARRPGAALSKFQRMRDSNAALSDSMSSSLLLHRSSTSSSRQLSSVPPMVPGTSTSASSSPGKPISPHTPHTPAIPSRLSANSIAEYSSQPTPFRNQLYRQESRAEEVTSDEATQQLGNTAPLDIPTSPRPFPPHNRRSSSVSREPRPLAVEDDANDIFPFGMRSASMGDDRSALDDDRPPLSLSALLRLREASETAIPAPERRERALQPAANLEEADLAMARQISTSSLESPEDVTQIRRGSTPGSGSSPYRPRLAGRSSGRGHTPPHTSYSSLPSDRFSGSGTSDRPSAGRYSFSRPAGNVEEEEPLLFAMSEIGHHSRRSLEEGRQGGGNTGLGGGDSASTSKRGSRPGRSDGGRGGGW
ncbi:MAG: autophagy protein 13 [Geoglossum umbratile]|nr:MAG: autophagy protein 13 [Geoglossum umbratile]